MKHRLNKIETAKILKFNIGVSENDKVIYVIKQQLDLL